MDEAVRNEPRSRLLQGMARAVAQAGFDGSTVADVVREAGVSRRTFYEHFAWRQACFIALYEAASHNALGVLRSAVDPAQPWDRQVEDGLRAYFGCMAAEPGLVRALFVDILQLGAPGLAARRRVHQELAAFLGEAVARGRPGARLAPAMALAVVGGINELVLEAIESGQAGGLARLVAPAAALVRAVTRP